MIERWQTDILVIGTGPSSAAAVAAIVAQGLRCEVLDVGVRLEKATEQFVSQIKARPVGTWSTEEVQKYKGELKTSATGLGKKKLHGSSFAYRKMLPFQMESQNMTADISHAFGGFGNVWGGAILPLHARDMADWPISQDELLPAYEKVAEIVPIAAENEGLADQFPLVGPWVPLPQLTPQTEALLQRAQVGREKLLKRRIYIGKARLAMGRETGGTSSGCRLCGLCLYGCPEDLIFNPKNYFEAEQCGGRVNIRPGFLVRKISQDQEGQVVVEGVRVDSQQEFAVRARKVFLGAGALATAAILAHSLPQTQGRLVVKDSQYYLIPFLFFKGQRIDKSSYFTMAQAFLEFQCFERNVHLQYYSYNDFYDTALDDELAFLPGWIKRRFKIALLRRTAGFQGYLHSDFSGHMIVESTPSDDRKIKVKITGVDNPVTRVKVRQVLRELLKLSLLFGGVPLIPMVQVPPPGRGFHMGASLPMSRKPDEKQSDLLGRPYGFRGLHIIDSSTFPTIPATAITYTTMANAYRIAEQSLKETT